MAFRRRYKKKRTYKKKRFFKSKIRKIKRSMYNMNEQYLKARAVFPMQVASTGIEGTERYAFQVQLFPTVFALASAANQITIADLGAFVSQVDDFRYCEFRGCKLEYNPAVPDYSASKPIQPSNAFIAHGKHDFYGLTSMPSEEELALAPMLKKFNPYKPFRYYFNIARHFRSHRVDRYTIGGVDAEVYTVENIPQNLAVLFAVKSSPMGTTDYASGETLGLWTITWYVKLKQRLLLLGD